MNPGQYRAACGCLLIIEPFTHGQRLVRCEGGGMLPSNGHGVGHRERCKGGVAYRVTPEQVVRYRVEPLKKASA